MTPLDRDMDRARRWYRLSRYPDICPRQAKRKWRLHDQLSATPAGRMRMAFVQMADPVLVAFANASTITVMPPTSALRELEPVTIDLLSGRRVWTSTTNPGRKWLSGLHYTIHEEYRTWLFQDTGAGRAAVQALHDGVMAGMRSLGRATAATLRARHVSDEIDSYGR